MQIYNRALNAEEVRFLYENKASMLSSSETEENDVWHVAVTANNGVEDSETINSNYLRIIPRLSVENVILNRKSRNYP